MHHIVSSSSSTWFILSCLVPFHHPPPTITWPPLSDASHMSRNLPPTLFRASVKVPIPSVGDPPNQRTAQAFLTTRVWVTEWLLETRYRQREARNKNVFFPSFGNHPPEAKIGSHQPVRRTRCTPLCESTIPLISPTRSENAASSNGFCICPGPNQPRSPSWSCEEQSECLRASGPNLSALPPISVLYPSKIAMASSFERVM